jgi:pimeloyl-ACP methyl ester carboxylesterase
MKIKSRLWTLGLAMLALTATIGSGAASAAPPKPFSFNGKIDGADFRVDVPGNWNGTLVLYSHGYLPVGFENPPGVLLANRTETEGWLLDHGYALAGSDFVGFNGATYEQGVRDQTKVLDWFDKNVKRPKETVALGSSSGGAMSVLMAERDPRRFSGVVSLCAPMDLNGQWNSMLDVSFAIRTLLAPTEDIELVHVTDADAAITKLHNAINSALSKPDGPAKLALIAALGDIPGWTTANLPRSTDTATQIAQQATLLSIIAVDTFGPRARVDLEQRAGGNPSYNIGVDYRRLLANSSERDLVERAYREAGQNLDADLNTLAAAPRVAPDLRALAWLYRFGVPRGTTPSPVLTVHNVADAAYAGHERWYAGQVDRAGEPNKLRQVYLNRPGHCAFTAAEEIVALRTMFSRLDTGRWPSVDPKRLNTSAAEFTDPTFQRAFDLASFHDVPVTPGFTQFTPAPAPRPSR